MSMETPNGNEQGTPAPPADEPKVIELVIRELPDGNVSVTGPLINKKLCYGLLGVARDVIAAYRPPDQGGRVINAADIFRNRNGKPL